MFNKTILIGHLGGDPQVQHNDSGAFGYLRLATNFKWYNEQKELQEETTWHHVLINGKTAENCKEFLKKGSLVFVEGRIVNREWTDRDGAARFSNDIRAERVKFLDRKGDQVDIEKAAEIMRRG